MSGVTKVLKTLQVKFGKIRFNYQFLLADVANPIQGMDFFTPYPKHGIQHVIKTMGHPVFAEAHRLDPDKLKTDKKEFRKLELAGIIPRSDSPWADVLLRRGFPRPKTTFF